MPGDSQPQTAIELSRAFFQEIVRPAMASTCPAVLDKAACGRFGWGSECFGLDDAVSRDHHWGPRVDLLLPADLFDETPESTWREVSRGFPNEFRGFPLEPGHVGGSGLAPESIDGFLLRTIGRVSVPATPADWMNIPEEDIPHVTNGEVWLDGAGQFTQMRDALGAYYPDDVWKRRLADWCRHASGMGLYAMQRALLRDNKAYAFTAMARTLKLTMEIAFLLSRRYFPYDKWLYPMFRNLPVLAQEMVPLVDEVVADGTSWERRLELFAALHDILDRRMVEMKLVRPHPAFKPSPTSGYRLLEWCYYDLLKSLPPGMLELVPRTQQCFMESWTAGYVAALGDEEWQGLLCLEPTPA